MRIKEGCGRDRRDSKKVRVSRGWVTRKGCVCKASEGSKGRECRTKRGAENYQRAGEVAKAGEVAELGKVAEVGEVR